MRNTREFVIDTVSRALRLFKKNSVNLNSNNNINLNYNKFKNLEDDNLLIIPPKLNYFSPGAQKRWLHISNDVKFTGVNTSQLDEGNFAATKEGQLYGGDNVYISNDIVEKLLKPLTILYGKVYSKEEERNQLILEVNNLVADDYNYVPVITQNEIWTNVSHLNIKFIVLSTRGSKDPVVVKEEYFNDDLQFEYVNGNKRLGDYKYFSSKIRYIRYRPFENDEQVSITGTHYDGLYTIFFEDTPGEELIKNLNATFAINLNNIVLPEIVTKNSFIFGNSNIIEGLSNQYVKGNKNRIITGDDTKGNFIHGYLNRVKNYLNFTFGQENRNEAYRSFVFGQKNDVLKSDCFVVGEGNKVHNTKGFVFGKYNSDGDYIFVIADGTDDNNRKNLLQLSRNGELILKGSGNKTLFRINSEGYAEIYDNNGQALRIITQKEYDSLVQRIVALENK